MKNKNVEVILAICFAFMLLYTLFTKSTSESMESEIESLKNDLDMAQTKNDLLDSQIEFADNKIMLLEQQLQSKGNYSNLYQTYVKAMIEKD